MNGKSDKSTPEQQAEAWAERRAGERKALIAYSDIHDAYRAGHRAGYAGGRAEGLDRAAELAEECGKENAHSCNAWDAARTIWAAIRAEKERVCADSGNAT